MNLLIKRLTPELAPTLVEYLESLDFGHAPHWATCYCRFYHTDCSLEEWQKRTGTKNRAEALNEIRAGRMKGYLAFDGVKCIGWCNANHVDQYLRLKEDLENLCSGRKLGCVICFVIHQNYRKQGVARALLRHAVQDFRSQGFAGVLSLPVESSDDPKKLYRGTINMYKELGFQEVAKEDKVRIMLLDFNTI